MNEDPIGSIAMIVGVVLAIFVMIAIARAVRIVPQSEAYVVERLGRFRSVLHGGIHLLVPFVDRVAARIDLREQVVNFPSQSVITADQAMVEIDSVIYFQITDPRSATYEVANFLQAIEQLTATTLRNLIGSLDLEETQTSRESINKQLRGVLDEATGPWGIRVTRVELKSIEPPPNVLSAMVQQITAERTKRATILTAEAEREAQIKKAEGAKQAAVLAASAQQEAQVLQARGEKEALILQAEGARQAQILRAEGEAEAISVVFNAINQGHATPELLSYKYLEMLPRIANGQASKLWVLPSDLTGALDAVCKGFGRSEGKQMKQQQEQVLRSVAQEDIRLIRLWFTDVAGVLKSVSIDPGELEEAFSEGIGFDGSSIEGLTRVYESDMLLRPDAATFQRLHTKDGTDVHGRMFCDVLTPDGLPSPADPRGALERAVQRASEMGFSVFAHPEIEFYLLRQPVDINHLEPVDQAGYFDHVTRGLSNDFRRKIVRALEETGIQVEFSHHEGGPGQNEVDLRAVDALHAADNIMTARTLIEEVALAEGMLATFMPKPFINRPGSGMHTHLSLFEGDENAFYDPSGRYQLSEIGRYFIAGLLHHAREIAAITNQHVNSYKRLWGGGEAPSYICWGHNNRSALVRVPVYKPSKRSSARIEYRGLDPAANPYLALAVLISAGLDGIEKKMPLAEEAEDNVWQLSETERQILGIHPLPSSLSDALRAMRSSDLVAEALGEQVFEHLLREKENEWREYRRQITPAELRQFLKVNG